MQLLIVLVGIDGTGKSTLATELASRLDAVGLRCPCDNTRAVLEHLASTPELQGLMFAHDFELCQKLASFSMSELKRHVVCDRWAPIDMLSYQLWGMRQNVDLVKTTVVPDLILYLDAPLDTCLYRVDNEDFVAQKSRDFWKRVLWGYEYAQQTYYQDRWHVLDASCSPQAVCDQALEAIRSAFVAKEKRIIKSNSKLIDSLLSLY